MFMNQFYLTITSEHLEKVLVIRHTKDYSDALKD